MIIQFIKDYEESILKRLGMKYEGLNWLELGDQMWYDGRVAKDIYEGLGVNHTSIDLNGRFGALPMDLSKPIPIPNEFDVITNYGTVEHVENQFECFKNIHNMCRVRGVMIHGVPLINNWPKHCRYYYTLQFFKLLAVHCSYQIMDLQILDQNYYKFPNNLVMAVFIKTKPNKFMTKKAFVGMEGIFDSGDKRKTQNYTI